MGREVNQPQNWLQYVEKFCEVYFREFLCPCCRSNLRLAQPMSRVEAHNITQPLPARNPCCRVQLKRDGTRWRKGGEVKGKLANGVGSQSPSHRFTLPRNLVYPALLPLMRTPRLPAVDWTDTPADLNGLVRFAERPNLVSERVPSHFKRTLLTIDGQDHS